MCQTKKEKNVRDIRVFGFCCVKVFPSEVATHKYNELNMLAEVCVSRTHKMLKLIFLAFESKR